MNQKSIKYTSQFLTAFAKKYRRKLRVLHLGNVANYGYVNAKLMREIGIEADCIDPDFYHIMATPEWHEAIISGDWANDFYPKLSAIKILGFSRPEWFVQGKIDLAFSLLNARNNNDNLRKAYFASRIELERRILSGDFHGFARWIWTSKNPLLRLFRGPYRRLQFLLDKLLAPSFKYSQSQKIELQNLALLDFMAPYVKIAPLVGAVTSYYDIVIGYTLSGSFAIGALEKNLIAYEIGTLRGLPYEDTSEGRLCKWLYTHAKEVFVTNVDCLFHARNIGIEERRITPMLHAYDIDLMISQSDIDISQLGINVGTRFLFAPARHHWKNGNSSWLKGNDVYLRALGKLNKEGRDFRLVTIDWGNEVDLSKSLIKECGYSDKVLWLKPQCRKIMKAIYQNSIGVIDQFQAAAIGGVALDTMASAKRLVTNFDAEACKQYFETSPPLHNCSDVETAYKIISSILDDPMDRLQKGEELKLWLSREHSVSRQMDDQMQVFERMFN